MSEFESLKEEERIREAFEDRNWNEIKTADSWVIFKVLAEFVEGFEKLSKIVLSFGYNCYNKTSGRF